MHTYLGFMCLFLCKAHVTLKGAYTWASSTWEDILPTLTLLSCLVPWLTLFLRILLWLPYLMIPLNKIRNGWERNDSYQEVKAQNGKVHPMEDFNYVNKGFDLSGV